MEAAEFDRFTERLRAALESARDVVGLVTLGTTADCTFRDEWSDHDFWVITNVGTQDSFLEDLSWLPDAHNIAITVRHRKGYTVLYRNRHKVEFAVFDVNEVHEGKAERYRVLIDRSQIAELVESVHQDTLKQAQASQARPDALENLCVLMWSACERHSRGEFLSARQYLDGFAVNQLLSLISVSDSETLTEAKDALDPRRRVEQNSPTLATEVLTILTNQYRKPRFTCSKLPSGNLSRRHQHLPGKKSRWSKAGFPNSSGMSMANKRLQVSRLQRTSWGFFLPTRFVCTPFTARSQRSC